MYNTDTAKQLARWSNGRGRDFTACDETLYRTKAGKYFLYGEGGPMSKYATSRGQNEWSGGEHIEPLSLATAMAWAENKLDGDEYVEVFGTPDDASDDKEPITLSMTEAVKRKLQQMQSESGKSMSQIVAEMIEQA